MIVASIFYKKEGAKKNSPKAMEKVVHSTMGGWRLESKLLIRTGKPRVSKSYLILAFTPLLVLNPLLRCRFASIAPRFLTIGVQDEE